MRDDESFLNKLGQVIGGGALAVLMVLFYLTSTGIIILLSIRMGGWVLRTLGVL